MGEIVLAPEEETWIAYWISRNERVGRNWFERAGLVGVCHIPLP